MQPEFETFPKIARLSRDVTITEKIDGTNAQIMIQRLLPGHPAALHAVARLTYGYDDSVYEVFAGSRSRWVTPGKSSDNHGFAGWVQSAAHDLVIGLGEGRHYGEWWGAGIQRGYNQREKHFSLFNTNRWTKETVPACCSVVPVLYQGDFHSNSIEAAVIDLRLRGSRASTNFMSPEGIVIYHSAARTYFKKTLEKDDEPKAIEARQVGGVWECDGAQAAA